MSQDVKAEDSKETHEASLKAHKTVIGGALNCTGPLPSVLKAVSSLLIGYSGTSIVFWCNGECLETIFCFLCRWISVEGSLTSDAL